MLRAIAAGVAVLFLVVLTVMWIRRMRAKRELEAHVVLAEELYELLIPEAKVQVFDVRVPLDLLAHSEMIPGAVRVAPKEVLENPRLISKDRDVVVYCTCPSDETSRKILRRALDHQFTNVKLLRGGLEGWKAKGYPVVKYDKAFHLDTAV